ncbi:unnamed protein product [Adineta ricciae]|uniref:CUB domain-containing protein n=1 Tax=Adineta ricciae TaxID=249248 RepID=A0A814IEU8_ADIRI|nr:unnamed protein product [Adineta ricciae]CAF1574471.1 unnamed protein product [Adineta ricciae]
MISATFLFALTLNLFSYTQSLQTGYTCETSVTLKCPSARKLVILEATYSSECPSVSEELNGTSIYPPTRCIGYYRERISTQCNGNEICTINNDLEQRPAFMVGKEANCNFKGQSINIEYSCVPDFYSSKLPRIDICSLQSAEDLKEGFLHTPNYPAGYPNDLSCTKKIPEPESGHRLKIYAVNFDVESATFGRSFNGIKLNDWLEINDNGEKLYGARDPFTLLFDDVIEASLQFKSNSANPKRAYDGFLLYFIIVPVRRSRPTTTTKIPSTSKIDQLFVGDLATIVQEKAAALKGDNRAANNTVLLLLVVLLSSVLFIILCAFLLYRRRNDRRIRYLTETFNAYMPRRFKFAANDSTENSDGSDLKFDVSSSSTADEKYISKYTDKQYHDSDHIYSQDPLENGKTSPKDEQNAIVYDYIDDNIIYQPIVKSNQNIV